MQACSHHSTPGDPHTRPFSRVQGSPRAGCTGAAGPEPGRFPGRLHPLECRGATQWPCPNPLRVLLPCSRARSNGLTPGGLITPSQRLSQVTFIPPVTQACHSSPTATTPAHSTTVSGPSHPQSHTAFASKLSADHVTSQLETLQWLKIKSTIQPCNPQFSPTCNTTRL